MKHYSQVVEKFLQPKEQLASVIDTYDVIGTVLETAQAAREGKFVDPKDINKMIINSMFALSYYPFWMAHSAAIRPLLLQAFFKDGNIVKNFFAEALPTALTIAMPNRQMEYDEIRKRVIAEFGD